MKDFSTYVNEYKEIYEFGNNQILTEGILKKISDWLGGTAGDYYNKVNTFYDELVNFSDNVIKAFNATIFATSSKINKKDTFPEDKRQKTMEETIGDGKDNKHVVNNIVNVARENINNDDFLNSPWAANYCASGILLARELKDKESERIILATFNKFSDEVKKNALNIQKEAGTEPIVNQENTDDKSNNTEDIKTDKGEDTIPDDVKDAVKDGVEKEVVKNDANEKNVDLNKFSDKISRILWTKFTEKDKDNIPDLEEITTMSTNIAQVILGMKGLNDSNLDKNVLSKYGIDDIDKFIKEVNKI